MSHASHTKSFADKSIFRCKLCWKVATGVFFAILVVEAAILFFSVTNYKRDRLAEVEREALVVMRVIVNVVETEGSFANRLATDGPRLRRNSVLLGARIFDLSGREITSFGDMPAIFDKGFEKTPTTLRVLSDDDSRMDVVWAASRFIQGYSVSARIDTGEIKPQISAFVWRIAGLVLLISTFVTLVTMLILEKSLLSPIRYLRDQLLAASEDSDNPARYTMTEIYTDEWGDVVHALNLMFTRSGGTLDKIKQQEKELTEHRDRLEKLVQKRTEKLEKARRQAEASNKAKSAFLANMSHELRTPLNAMIGFSDLQCQEAFGPMGNENYLDFSNEINSSSKHLLGLINTLLDVTKLESGEFELCEDQFDMGQSLQTSINVLKNSAQASDVSVVFEAPENSIILFGDEKRIRQAIGNLLSNAIKFSQSGDQIEVHVRFGDAGGLYVDIIDTGIGMDEEGLQSAIETFGQGEVSYARSHGGTGLGVTLTRAILDLHGGSLTFKSAPGAGTTATAFFPASRLVTLTYTDRIQSRAKA